MEINEICILSQRKNYQSPVMRQIAFILESMVAGSVNTDEGGDLGDREIEDF